ncbi:MAG: FAD-dependent oxidoreductase [Firmicutes bacterium]|nr:FAD-dependent oxidoreductase [Bacillota bacterium]
MNRKYDYIILGSGIFGLYAAKKLVEKGLKVAILEYDSTSFSRASYINQARVHRGYHYPRSFTTAMKSASYFHRFNKDFSFAINNKFKKVYGIAKDYSLTSGEQFKMFCKNSNIPCAETKVDEYFDSRMVEKAFITEEYSFDSIKIKEYLLEYLKGSSTFNIFYNTRISGVSLKGNNYYIHTNLDYNFISHNVINATYASVNQVIEKFGYEKFDIKYEISEIILCDTSERIKDIGLTLMDGPFFSVMPFGLRGVHSLTSVTFTHHKTSFNSLPKFDCQNNSDKCSVSNLENCNICKHKPKTAWINMNQLSKKYLNSNIKLVYIDSLFSIKPILSMAKLDDSRPTVIVENSTSPRFVSVLSGKINTIYDLDEVI